MGFPGVIIVKQFDKQVGGFLGGHQLCTSVCLSVCPCPPPCLCVLFVTLQHLDTRTPGHWDTKTLVHQDTGTPGHWDTRTIGGAGVPSPPTATVLWFFIHILCYLLFLGSFFGKYLPDSAIVDKTRWGWTVSSSDQLELPNKLAFVEAAY